MQAVLDMGDHPWKLVVKAAQQLAVENRIPSDARKGITAVELLLFCDKLKESQGAKVFSMADASVTK